MEGHLQTSMNMWVDNNNIKHRLLSYICSQPGHNTYYIDDSSGGTRVAAGILHKEEEIIIRLNDSASVMDAEMKPKLIALEEATG